MSEQTKSYTPHVVLVIVLYLFLFVPGLIANVIFHNEGRRAEIMVGRSLPGVAALGLLRRGSFLILLLLLSALTLVLLLPLLRAG